MKVGSLTKSVILLNSTPSVTIVIVVRTPKNFPGESGLFFSEPHHFWSGAKRTYQHRILFMGFNSGDAVIP